MSKRTTMVLAVIAAALLAFILLYERHTLSSGDLEGREDRLFESFVRDQVTKLEIERGDERIVLERELGEDGELGDWTLVEPVRAETDFDAVDTLVGALDWANARRTIGGVTAEDRERFGLAEPRLSAWFTVAERRVPIVIGGEDPQESGLYLQSDDESVAHVVGRDLFEALDHDASWFRAKELLADAAPSRAERVTIAGQGGERRLVHRDGAWWIEAPVEGLASSGTVQEMLRELHDLRAEAFVADDPADLSPYGLDSPAHVVSLSRPRADGNATVEATLAVGRACDEHEGAVYARVGDGPVVCVDADATAPLATSAEDLRERRLVTARDDEVERIEIVSGNRRLELWREERAWKLRSKEGPREHEATADRQGVSDLLRSLRDARVRSFAAADADTVRARGLGNPTATLSLHLASDVEDEERRAVVTLGLSDAEAAWFRRGDEPVVLALDPAARDLFTTSALPFRERRLVDEDDEEAARLLVRRANEREVVERTDEGWRVTEPLAAPADSAVLRTVARGFAGLTAERFVAERPAPEHGLDAPRLVVEARFETGDRDDDHGHDHGEPEEEEERPAVREHTLRIGAATEGGAFARLGDDPTVFVVEQGFVDALDGPLVDRGLLATDRRHVEGVEVERNGRPAADAPGDALLATIETLRAADTAGYGAPPPAAGLARPRARLTVTRTADGPEPRSYTILLGAEDAGRVHARRADLEVGFLLPAEAAAALLGE